MREGFCDAVVGGEGVIVIVDSARIRTAHPVSCPTPEARHFVEKVIRMSARTDATTG
jgi:hypothetical protein